jgi:tRNA A-37 threonylcarbamoyl transferase component Bud32
VRRELREETVPEILADLGVLDRSAHVDVRSLSGGVANAVFAARWRDGAVVVKQALPELRVEAEWRFDTARTQVEADCLAYLADVWPKGAAPALVALDAENDILVMSHAPDGGSVWKDQLLAGIVDPATAARVGELVGTLHARAAGDANAIARFGPPWPLLQGRVEPFHRTAAAVNPDLSDAILTEVDRLLATKQTLVLGDCSPKNVIAYDDRVLLLDFEVAHYGDPAFDIAFVLTHLVLKACRAPQFAAVLRRSATVLLESYAVAAAAPLVDGPVTAELGCLLLSRVDGKSPAEYVTEADKRDAVRAAARVLLTEPPPTLESALDLSFGIVATAEANRR